MSDATPVLSAPLTEAQSGLWYAQRMDPQNPLFNTGHWIELRGSLQVSHFELSVNQAVYESDALCLRFDESDPRNVRQYVDENHRPKLQMIDVSAEQDPRAAAMALMEKDSTTPLDPVRDVLACQHLYKLADDHYLWYQRIHHLLIDGYGITLLSQRIAELYNAAVDGSIKAGPALASLQVVFDDDSAYRNSNDENSKRHKDAAYWHEYLKGLPEVVGLANGKAVSAHTYERASGVLPETFLDQLKARADGLNMSWTDLLTLLSAIYCQRFINAAEIVVGVPWMGRLGSAVARVPAMVMNVLPLRISVPSDQNLEAVAADVSKALIKARRHGRYRSEQMRRDLGLLGGHRRLYGPMINILPFEQPPVFAGLGSQLHIMSTGPVDDMTLTFRGDGRKFMSLDLDLNPELYEAGQAQEHTERLLSFLARAVQQDNIHKVPLASDEEAEYFLKTVNQTQHPVADTTLTALIESGMSQWADRPALVFGEQTLTYAELEARTRALALQLHAKGIGPESLVAVATPRSLELVIALVAVLRAGAAYLPLDMEHPAERLQKILNSARPRCVLSLPQQHVALAALTDIEVLVSTDWNTDAGAERLPQDRMQPDSLAYVIYTSGSTGEPKGVMIEHRAIVNRLEWMRTHYNFTPDDRILQKTPSSFDVSVWEFFLAFISGGSLVVSPPGAHRDPVQLVNLIKTHQITTLHFVPSMLSMFLDEPSAFGLKLERVFCSGEELTADQCDRFHQTIHAELHNLYGPTEAAVDISYWPATKGSQVRPIPIGYPVWNSRLYILDDQLQPVPAGVPGHLYLAGVQLARGYLGRPDLTNERFVPDPFVPGERMYLTGDVARWRHDGSVVYLGRSDHQVKIRGLRIELGEIEAALMSSEMVRQGNVIVHEDKTGYKRLVAYVVPDHGYDSAQLRAHMLTQVPDYMVPQAFVSLEQLPVTSNGKLDRRALPAPVFTAESGLEPSTPTEAALAALYAEVLGLSSPVFSDSDFFDLGGDSLLAVQLMLRIRQQFGREPGLGALFDKPSVEALAQVIDATQGDDEVDDGLQPLIKLATGDETLAPLFVVHPVGGISWCYRYLARGLASGRTVYGLQAPSLDPSVTLPDSIEALAAVYVDNIISVQPEGPYHIAGWSVGGIIAHAMAVRLQQLGKKTGVIAMFDSYPSECWRAEAAPTPEDALRALLAVAGFVPDDYPHLHSRDAVIGFLRQSKSVIGGMPDHVLDGIIRVVQDLNRLVRQHYHQRVYGTVLHLKAALDHQETGLNPQQWAPHVEHIDVVELPFLHYQLTGPAASTLIAGELDKRMTAMDGRHQSTSV